MIEIGSKTAFLRLCTKNKQNLRQGVQMGARHACSLRGVGAAAVSLAFGKHVNLMVVYRSQGWQKPWQFCWGNSNKSHTDQALASKSKLAKMFSRMCRLPGLVESNQRQFAPACGRSTNAAKDGPTPAPGLVFCEAGFFVFGFRVQDTMGLT